MEIKLYATVEDQKIDYGIDLFTGNGTEIPSKDNGIIDYNAEMTPEMLEFYLDYLGVDQVLNTDRVVDALLDVGEEFYDKSIDMIQVEDAQIVEVLSEIKGRLKGKASNLVKDSGIVNGDNLSGDNAFVTAWAIDNITESLVQLVAMSEGHTVTHVNHNLRFA